MAEFDSSDIKIEIDNTGGTLVDLTTYVLDAPGIMVKRATDDDWTPLGAVLQRKGIVAIDIVDDFEWTFKLDDVATTGPWAVLNARGSTRTVKVTYGGSITRSIEAGIVGCDPVIENGKKQRIKAAFVNVGTAISET